MNYDDFDPKNLEPFKDLINDLGHPSATAIGKALGGLFSGALYYPIKLGIYTQYKLDEYQKKVTTKLNEIPDENKDASKLGLVMKEIEDSKYQLDSETLQEMFARLVSATVDNRKNQNISPRYSLILSQLGPIDARFLNQLAKNNYNGVLPCFRIFSKDKDNGSKRPVSSKFIGLNFKMDPHFSNDASLDILISLGLVTYHEDAWLTADIATEFYESVEKSTQFIDKKKQHENEKNEIILDKNYLEFTKFGEQFIRVVC
ncbi:DUF4393 domain-containing protein [Companilactobacillus farciminis]|uniref:DUF4393 domain-containing protein n=1 Tax=Companilactobacillus farciminis TaxID=1612 RepID=UPI002330FA87|nr:DUF4393 domain-containing protein [Companilactobacillus farciminis]WCG34779.1 DUF4393 domain-containing protein [Companilactobacillus farciminis]